MAISINELHWASGFLEGEGTFSAVPSGKRPNGNIRKTFNPMVHAGQVNREPLERIQKLFGGNIYKHNMHTGHPCWRWQVAGKKSIGIMMTMWSMMSGKRRQQIEQSISRWKSNRSYKDAALRGDAWKEVHRGC